MTCCVGIKLDAGLVFSPTRAPTPASTRSAPSAKMMVYEQPGERFMVMLSAGNLSISQSVREILQTEKIDNPGGGRSRSGTPPACSTRARAGSGGAHASTSRTALAQAERHRLQRLDDLRRADQGRGDAPLPGLFGRQLHRGHAETCFFQGRREQVRQAGARPHADAGHGLDEAAKCALVSMDSTLKSNLSVGLPLDLLVYEREQFASDKIARIDEHNPYFPHDPQQLGPEAAPGVRVDRGSALERRRDGAPAARRRQPVETMRKITHPGERII